MPFWRERRPGLVGRRCRRAQAGGGAGWRLARGAAVGGRPK